MSNIYAFFGLGSANGGLNAAKEALSSQYFCHFGSMEDGEYMKIDYE
jgi:hypothetical protein